MVGPEASSLEGGRLVDGADFDALLIIEDRKIDGPREMIFRELEGSAHIDDLVELREIDGQGDRFHAVERHWYWRGFPRRMPRRRAGSSGFHHETDLNTRIEREGRHSHCDAGVFSARSEDF